MKALVVVISGLLLATPALAQTGGGVVAGSGAELSERGDLPESTGADSDERAADGERRICRRIEIATSSRMSTRRICRTAAEWREAQRAH